MDNARAAFSESEKLSSSLNYSDWYVCAKLLLQDWERWDGIIVHHLDPSTFLRPTKIHSFKTIAPQEPQSFLAHAYDYHCDPYNDGLMHHWHI